MLGNIFTLDYEIHGNGDGSPYDLMVEPTARMIRLFDRYSAKLTIMADVAEIIKFKEYNEEKGVDLFCYHQIENQLQDAVDKGHDVQLHIHPSYFNSSFSNNKWHQDWSEYSLADLEFERMSDIIRTCKDFLEEIIRPVNPEYSCKAFRSGNWSMVPSFNIVNCLIDNGIKIDTSVFKYGKRVGTVNFDYKNAYSDLLPWPVDENNIFDKDPNGMLTEFPIYCENKNIWSFLSPNRFYRILQSRKHKHPLSSQEEEQIKPKTKASMFNDIFSLLTQKHALKMDFNQCSGGHLIRILKGIDQKYGHMNMALPVVLIGHSKLYTRFNASSLEPFLKFISNSQDKYFFATFNDFDLDQYRN